MTTTLYTPAMEPAATPLQKARGYEVRGRRNSRTSSGHGKGLRLLGFRRIYLRQLCLTPCPRQKDQRLTLVWEEEPCK